MCPHHSGRYCLLFFCVHWTMLEQWVRFRCLFCDEVIVFTNFILWLKCQIHFGQIELSPTLSTFVCFRVQLDVVMRHHTNYFTVGLSRHFRNWEPIHILIRMYLCLYHTLRRNASYILVLCKCNQWKKDLHVSREY